MDTDFQAPDRHTNIAGARLTGIGISSTVVSGLELLTAATTAASSSELLGAAAIRVGMSTLLGSAALAGGIAVTTIGIALLVRRACEPPSEAEVNRLEEAAELLSNILDPRALFFRVAEVPNPKDPLGYLIERVDDLVKSLEQPATELNSTGPDFRSKPVFVHIPVAPPHVMPQ